MKLTQKQVYTVKTLFEFRHPTGFFDAELFIKQGLEPNNEQLSYLNDLNNLYEVYWKVAGKHLLMAIQSREMESSWLEITKEGGDIEQFAHTLAQIITELKLNDKEK